MNIFELSKRNQQIAWQILEDSGLVRLWETIRGEVNVVGSLKTGLLIHRDIDIHVYTDKVSVQESFSVMGELCERLKVTDVQYKNLINTEEECVEWHALFEDKNQDLWKLDLIHIRKGSKYDGVVEKVADAICNKLTPELREIILRIKYDMPKEAIIPGIEVYHAVFTGKVRTYDELLNWRKSNPLTNSLDWLP
ncbi:MAG: phosphoglycerate mutase family protein [Bacteroidales bacterium]|nr:phosphoglycerate mutase family protein [Bacteroidales bacterium]